MRPTVHVITRADQAMAALESTRLQLLVELREPNSASSLARKLGLKRQIVNYHVRALERVGLIEFCEERAAGQMVERVYRAIADRFVILPSVLGDLAPDGDEPLSAACQTLADMSAIRPPDAPPISAHRSTIAFRDRESRLQFVQEITNIAARLGATYNHGGIGGEWSLNILAYQMPRKST